MTQFTTARLVDAYKKFGFELFAQMVAEGVTENMVVSPLSIAIALSMAYNGARHNTASALSTVLGLGDVPLEQVNAANKKLLKAVEYQGSQGQLSLANALWVKQGIELNTPFAQRLQTAYSGKAESIDFSDNQAAQAINRWVSQKTQGKIEQLVDSEMLKAAILVLINAIYFKGSWANKFDPNRTKEQPFTQLDGSTQRHPMMSRTGDYRCCETPLFQAIRLPYANQRTSLYIFMPQPDVPVQRFKDHLTTENWNSWLPKLKDQEVKITLPRFKAVYQCNLNDALSRLGLEIIFSSQANFRGMGTGDLMVSRVVHKAVLSVNEEGAEAAAATAVIMVRSMRQTFEIVINRPFFYAICDEQSGVILFMGFVVNPSSP